MRIRYTHLIRERKWERWGPGVGMDTNRVCSLNKASTEITQPSSIAEMLASLSSPPVELILEKCRLYIDLTDKLRKCITSSTGNYHQFIYIHMGCSLNDWSRWKHNVNIILSSFRHVLKRHTCGCYVYFLNYRLVTSNK